MTVCIRSQEENGLWYNYNMKSGRGGGEDIVSVSLTLATCLYIQCATITNTIDLSENSRSERKGKKKKKEHQITFFFLAKTVPENQNKTDVVRDMTRMCPFSCSFFFFFLLHPRMHRSVSYLCRTSKAISKRIMIS